mgnify:CR=1 FL=1
MFNYPLFEIVSYILNFLFELLIKFNLVVV